MEWVLGIGIYVVGAWASFFGMVYKERLHFRNNKFGYDPDYDIPTILVPMFWPLVLPVVLLGYLPYKLVVGTIKLTYHVAVNQELTPHAKTLVRRLKN